MSYQRQIACFLYTKIPPIINRFTPVLNYKITSFLKIYKTNLCFYKLCKLHAYSEFQLRPKQFVIHE